MTMNVLIRKSLIYNLGKKYSPARIFTHIFGYSPRCFTILESIFLSKQKSKYSLTYLMSVSNALDQKKIKNSEYYFTDLQVCEKVQKTTGYYFTDLQVHRSNCRDNQGYKKFLNRLMMNIFINAFRVSNAETKYCPARIFTHIFEYSLALNMGLLILFLSKLKSKYPLPYLKPTSYAREKNPNPNLNPYFSNFY